MYIYEKFIHLVYETLFFVMFKVRIYIILGDMDMHLALIDAMYKLHMIGTNHIRKSSSSTSSAVSWNQRATTATGPHQQNHRIPEYFVVGVNKDVEWDAEGKHIMNFRYNFYAPT